MCVVNGRFEQLDLSLQSQSFAVANAYVLAGDERLVGIGLGAVECALLGSRRVQPRDKRREYSAFLRLFEFEADVAKKLFGVIAGSIGGSISPSS